MTVDFCLKQLVLEIDNLELQFVLLCDFLKHALQVLVLQQNNFVLPLNAAAKATAATLAELKTRACVPLRRRIVKTRAGIAVSSFSFTVKCCVSLLQCVLRAGLGQNRRFQVNFVELYLGCSPLERRSIGICLGDQQSLLDGDTVERAEVRVA